MHRFKTAAVFYFFSFRHSSRRFETVNKRAVSVRHLVSFKCNSLADALFTASLSAAVLAPVLP